MGTERRSVPDRYLLGPDKLDAHLSAKKIAIYSPDNSTGDGRTRTDRIAGLVELPLTKGLIRALTYSGGRTADPRGATRVSPA